MAPVLARCCARGSPLATGAWPAGDVNIFLNDHDEPHTAEIEIMVAEPRRCRLKRGWPAV